MDHIVEPTEEEIISEVSFIEMKAYVKYCLYFGYSKQEIVSALKSVGWNDSEISKAFSILQAKHDRNILSPKPKEIAVPKAHNNQEVPISMKEIAVSQEMEAPRPSS